MIKKTGLFSILLVTICIASKALAQTDIQAWPADEVATARKASQVQGTTAKAAEVIFYTNLARINGPMFVKLILNPYLQKKGMKMDSYTKSLINTLNEQASLKPLESDLLLQKKAEKYASSSGVWGVTGHANFNMRLGPVMHQRDAAVGENCSYGFDDPLDIVIALLIDKGISDLGHRKNMLSTTFKKIGVGLAHHVKYGHDCVMDFSG